MKLNAVPEVDTLNDASLVELGLSGHRDAFGQLVARYQSGLCALAYSACGDISQSQDLAQETFIIAWRKLGDLKEPAKFKAWLFGIARNLINNSVRRQIRNPLSGAEPLDETLIAPAAASNPAGHAMSKEEQEILWRSLEHIPETYREPLILFYREHESIERVAATLDLSEEAVRQRLSRGRKLLQEQILAFVEGALKQTVPSQAFTLSVLTALPAMTISTKTITLGTTAKGGALVKGAGLAGVFASVVTPLLMFWGMWMQYRSLQKAAHSAHERRIYRIYYLGIVISVVGMILIISLLQSYGRWLFKINPWLFAGLNIGLILGYLLAIFCSARWFFRSVKKANEGLPVDDVSGRMKTFSSWEYRSRFELLGLPFIHVRFGYNRNGCTMGWQPAVKAWIAITDSFAFGVLFAYAGVAVAPVSIGACAIGLFSYGAMATGGLAIGGFAFGGWSYGAFATGWQAFGDTVVAWNAACGGQYAIAHDFATAASASAAHANDALAEHVMKSNLFFRFCWTTLRPRFLWLIWAPVIPMTILMILGLFRNSNKSILNSEPTKSV